MKKLLYSGGCFLNALTFHSLEKKCRTDLKFASDEE